MNTLKRKKVIVDIGHFSLQKGHCGVFRVTVEILQRLIAKKNFDIVLIDSLHDDVTALQNFKAICSCDIPFQGKYVEHFVLPTKSLRPTFLGRLEDKFTSILPDSKLLRFLIGLTRTIKWKIKPPPAPVAQTNWKTERKPSFYLTRLISESDIYFSPFCPFPEEIVVNSLIHRVLILHDLIPLLYKDKYNIGSLLLEDLFSQLTPDTTLFANSEYTKNDVLQHMNHVKSDQIIVIPLAANDCFKPSCDNSKSNQVRKKYKIPAESNYIISMACKDVRKNVETILRAFDLLLKMPKDCSYQQIPTDIYLVLCGIDSGKDKNSSQVLENVSNLTRKRIIFTGYVDDIDLPFLYDGASCFCYMSLYEGFGLPPLEAMQSGTPVITSNTSSLPEVVGDAGIMLDPYDVEGLANAMYRVISDENLRKEMIAKGLEQAKKFNWDDCVNIICDKII